MYCQKCGQALKDGDTGCPSCESKAVQNKICASCQKEILADSIFCEHCGQSQDSSVIESNISNAQAKPVTCGNDSKPIRKDEHKGRKAISANHNGIYIEIKYTSESKQQFLCELIVDGYVYAERHWQRWGIDASYKLEAHVPGNHIVFVLIRNGLTASLSIFVNDAVVSQSHRYM